jgi:hypothetical protein
VSELSVNRTFFQIPFAAVTFCPDLLSHNKEFDYNMVVEALQQREISIENVTSDEFVDFHFNFLEI